MVGADDQVKTDVFTAVAAVAKSILKNGKLTQESAVVRLCRAIIADAAIYPLPQPLENADEKFDRPIWSPTPSIEAAQAIIHFVYNWGLNSDLESLLRKVSANKSPEVRFQIAVGLGSLYNRKREVFWDIADSMLSAERTTGVLEALARTVGQPFIAQHEPEAVVGRKC